MAYLVKRYMSKDVPTIGAQAMVAEAAKAMMESKQGFLLVLKEGRPVGIITEHDLAYKVVAVLKDPTEVVVEAIMSTPLITVDPDEDFLMASEIMQKNNIRRLPVVKDGIIYGMVTARDIAQHCRDYLEQSTKDIVRGLSFGM